MTHAATNTQSHTGASVVAAAMKGWQAAYRVLGAIVVVVMVPVGLPFSHIDLPKEKKRVISDTSLPLQQPPTPPI